MATSITHRVTGVGLAFGTIVLAWWLVAIASGPEPYRAFLGMSSAWPGQLVLFGLAWALAYHLLNGIRHLAWDLGYGFGVKTAAALSWTVILASAALAVAFFALAYSGYGGFLR
jgi:succinate dehydrogenase / fumarate reductase cytochrome b subunit